MMQGRGGDVTLDARADRFTDTREGYLQMKGEVNLQIQGEITLRGAARRVYQKCMKKCLYNFHTLF